LEEKGRDKHEQRENYRDEIAGFGIGDLAGKNLDSILEVDPRDVKAESIAGE